MASKVPELSTPDTVISPIIQQASVPQSPSFPTASVSPLTLRVTVIRGCDLAPKDRNGASDPYLVLTLGDAQEATSIIHKTLNPQWNQTMDLPIVGPQSKLLEAVCWDKDRFGKDYMGEFDLKLEDLFSRGDQPGEVMCFPLISRRTGKKDSNVTGTIELKCQVVDPGNPAAPASQTMSNLKSLLSTTSQDTLTDSETDSNDKPTPSSSKLSLLIPRLRSKAKPSKYALSGDMDSTHGVLFVDVLRITDLPPEKNVTRTGFDMDPFVVVSFSKKTYRTNVVRHDLNPVFNKRFYFTVSRGEINFSISFSVIDKDKMSGNDHVGDVTLPLATLLKLAPQPDPITGLYPAPAPEVPEAELNTTSEANLVPEPKKSRFWPLSRTSSSQNLQKVPSSPAAPPTDEPTLGPVSSSLYSTTMAVVTPPDSEADPAKIEMVTSGVPAPATDVSGASVLALPLVLKNQTMWAGKHNPVLHLRAKYVPYKALRQQFWRAMLTRYDTDGSGRTDRGEMSAMLDALGSVLHKSTVDGFFERFAAENNGDSSSLSFDQAIRCLEDHIQGGSNKPDSLMSKMNDLAVSASPGAEDDAVGIVPAPVTVPLHSSPTDVSLAEASSGYTSDSTPSNNSEVRFRKDEEHLIEIPECPICHQPRLGKRSDSDILVHIAVCADQDWRKLADDVSSSYATPSRAQRKWLSHALTRLSYGPYKIGANSANIFVQDRLSGVIIEERMSSYVRLFIRIMYQGTRKREMEAKSVRKWLKILTIRQGKKFDDPTSAREIAGFIRFHNLNMDEVLRPISEFKTFNEFFYRELVPGCRPCCEPDRPEIAISPADCRSVVFSSITEAQKLWVKGREFTIARLFGDAYPDDVSRYVNGSMAIFRLAPQDYHRFHIPVDGVLGTPKLIEGEYYTVNPMAIRSTLDVYGENVRVLVPIDSTNHGRVMVVCVGAMMVGSTVITATAGQTVARADELGYFKFGGSTLLVFFEPDRLRWDEDLEQNSAGALETLVRVGMSIGRTPNTAPPRPVHEQVAPTVTNTAL